MKKLFGLLLISVTVLLSACGDGVPKVDDPHHPLDADGKPIKGIEFIKKYCAGKSDNENCAKVSIAVNQDSSRGPMPEGW